MVHCYIVLSSILTTVDLRFLTHLTTKYVGLKQSSICLHFVGGILNEKKNLKKCHACA